MESTHGKWNWLHATFPSGGRQRRLKAGRRDGKQRSPDVHGSAASIALVSDEAGTTDAGIDLALGDGRRLRIHRGVEQATL